MLVTVENLKTCFNDNIKNINLCGAFERFSTLLDQVYEHLTLEDIPLIEKSYNEAIHNNDEASILCFLIENHEGLISTEKLLIMLFKKCETNQIVYPFIVQLINDRWINLDFISKNAGKMFLKYFQAQKEEEEIFEDDY